MSAILLNIGVVAAIWGTIWRLWDNRACRIVDGHCAYLSYRGRGVGMTGPSPEQIAALLSKREAIINRLCAEKKQLELQLVKAHDGLKMIASMARFELEHPTDLRDTAFSLIEKKAKAALTEDTGK